MRSCSCCGCVATSRSWAPRSRWRCWRPSAGEHRQPKLVKVTEVNGPAQAVRLRVGTDQPLDSRCHRRRHPHRCGSGTAHRRHQTGPAPARRQAHRSRWVQSAGDRGVDPFLVDSTNAGPGTVTPERRDRWRSTKVIGKARQRVIVAFASHVHPHPADHRRRARPAGHVRRAFTGPANMQIAQTWGICRCPTGWSSTSTPAATLPDHRVVDLHRVARASCCRRCRGWRAANTGRSNIRADGLGSSRLLADPGQRELCVRGGQRPGWRGATTSQLVGEGARVRHPGSASCCTRTTRCAPPT